MTYHQRSFYETLYNPQIKFLFFTFFKILEEAFFLLYDIKCRIKNVSKLHLTDTLGITRVSIAKNSIIYCKDGQAWIYRRQEKNLK